MRVATRISCSRRSRAWISPARSRTSSATRTAGAACVARLASRRRSSVEYSCSESRGPRLSVPINSPWLIERARPGRRRPPAGRARPASRVRGRASSTGPGRLEVRQERVARGDLDTCGPVASGRSAGRRSSAAAPASGVDGSSRRDRRSEWSNAMARFYTLDRPEIVTRTTVAAGPTERYGGRYGRAGCTVSPWCRRLGSRSSGPCGSSSTAHRSWWTPARRSRSSRTLRSPAVRRAARPWRPCSGRSRTTRLRTARSGGRCPYSRRPRRGRARSSTDGRSHSVRTRSRSTSGASVRRSHESAATIHGAEAMCAWLSRRARRGGRRSTGGSSWLGSRSVPARRSTSGKAAEAEAHRRELTGRTRTARSWPGRQRRLGGGDRAARRWLETRHACTSLPSDC